MKSRYSLLVIIFILGITIHLCPRQSQAQETRKIKIVTTIGPITDAVRIIGRNRVFVKDLMGAVNPHEYRASESDVAALTEADLIFYCGFYLEAEMVAMFKRLKEDIPTVPLAEAVPVELRLEGANYEGQYDPHIWFDVTLWQMAVEEIALTLAEYDPEYKDRYLDRAANYNAQLDNLNAYISRRAQELPEEKRVFVTAHNAFRYFGRKYGFEVVSLQGISTEAQAGTEDVLELADFITKRKIHTIFTESSVPGENIKAVQNASQRRGWEIGVSTSLFSDTLGNEGTFEGTYIGALTYLIDTIVDATKDPL